LWHARRGRANRDTSQREPRGPKIASPFIAFPQPAFRIE
jgi:hypothetical protein